MCKFMKLVGRLMRGRRTQDSELHLGASKGRQRTFDVSFTYRMGAGVAGDVNRGHPASIQPTMADASAPPTAYGQAVVVDPTTQGVRPLTAGDTALTTIWGVTVRPYPIQAASATNYGATSFGGGAPPASQPVDVLRAGYIMVSTVGAPVKGGPVFVWIAASGGGHVQGGFEAAASAGNTIALDPTLYQFNSPPDSNGIAELILGGM